MPLRTYGFSAGQHEASLRTSYSNIFEFFQTFDHEVLIDFEIMRSELAWQYGLRDNLAVNITLPIVHTGGGFLDAFVSGFHNTFGLPNAGRELFANNLHAFHLQDLNTTNNLYDIGTVDIGLGDTQIGLHHRLLEQAPGRPGLTLGAMLEIPTGRSSTGTGNGSLDYGLSMQLNHSKGCWHLHSGIGYFVGAPTKELADFSRNQHFSFYVGGEVSLPKNLALHAQIHGGTPLLVNVDNGRWTDMPLDFIIGLSGEHRLRKSQRTFFWQLGFSEDLHANGPSIDFTTLLELGFRWGRNHPRP